MDKDKRSFKEVYGWTGVQYLAFSSALNPSPLFGYGLEMNLGWLRKKQRVNISSKYYERSDWVGFLTKTLDLDLALDGEVSRNNIRAAVDEIVQAGTAPTRAEWDLISTHFDGVGIGRNAELQEADYVLALDIIKNPAFPMPKRLYRITAFAIEHKNLAARRELADLLLTRLESGKTWIDALNVKVSRDVVQVASGLSKFSLDALSGHFDRIERLSHDPFMQEHGYVLLKHARVYGTKAAPMLMMLVDIGIDGKIRENRYQHPYLAGIGGLCLLGPKGARALPRIQELMVAQRIPSNGSYGKLLMNTLTSLKADPELIWSFGNGITKTRHEKNLKSI